MGKSFDEMLKGVLDLQKEVGEFQLGYFRNLATDHIREKQAKDLVTEADVKSEQLLKKGLLDIFPDAAFFGEESGRSGDSKFLWVVDPIDGTTNFVSGLDQFCISVALLEDDKPVLGSIFRPPTQESFTAIDGAGAFHNQRPLAKRGPTTVDSSLIATGFPYRSLDLRRSFYKCADRVLDETRGIRRMGSAALDLAFVASGFFEGFWETDLQPYDVAAGLVLLNETGCSYSDFSGKAYDPFTQRSLVCGAPGVFEFLQGVTASAYEF